MSDNRPELSTVRALDGLTVALWFENGETRILDLTARLDLPHFEPMRIDIARFRQVRVEGGTLVWPDGLAVAPECLYEGSHPTIRTPVPSTRVLTLDDLAPDQLSWVPSSSWDAYSQWPCGTRVEHGESPSFRNDSEDAAWDWRSLVIAARAYPGWSIELEPPGYLRAWHRGEYQGTRARISKAAIPDAAATGLSERSARHPRDIQGVHPRTAGYDASEMTTPPAAPMITTAHAGTRHEVSRTKQISARTNGPGPVIAVVKTGL